MNEFDIHDNPHAIYVIAGAIAGAVGAVASATFQDGSFAGLLRLLVYSAIFGGSTFPYVVHKGWLDADPILSGAIYAGASIFLVPISQGALSAIRSRSGSIGETIVNKVLEWLKIKE